jgi:hypothetical protein
MKRTDLITLTEIATPQRAEALRSERWGLCWHRGADTGVLYRRVVFRAKWCRDRFVTNARYFSQMTRRWVRPSRITAAMLVEKASSGRQVLVTVGHAVSCAFSRFNDGWIPDDQLCSNGRRTTDHGYIRRNSLRVPAYKAHLKGWADWVTALVGMHDPDVVVTTGDFNLDFKKHWVRKYLAHVWKESEMSWKKWADGDYTHLMRTYHGTYKVLLDGTFVSGEGVSFSHGSVSFPEMTSSDHSPTEDIIDAGVGPIP